MAGNAREGRRKRILERGSDRLAFITGHIQTLPNSSISHSTPTVPPQDEAEESDPILLKPDPVIDDDHSGACTSSGSKMPPLHEVERNQILNAPTSEVEQVQPPPGPSVISSEVNQVQPLPNPSNFILGAERQSYVQSRNPKLFTPGEISSAITASKIMRLGCSIFVALLVVFSYLGFPLPDNKYVKSILNFKPLYLVLVTNATIVVAQLTFGKQRGSESAARRRQDRASSNPEHWTENLGRALEAALVMRNVMDAMFMDCASYAVTVICGLSLVQFFGH